MTISKALRGLSESAGVTDFSYLLHKSCNFHFKFKKTVEIYKISKPFIFDFHFNSLLQNPTTSINECKNISADSKIAEV
jgi:hypothetical protein